MINLKPPSGSLITLLAVAFVAFRYCIHETDQSLGDPARTSGWFLLGSFVLLCVYGVRKKLPFLPLGKTSTWLMLHLTTGVLGGYFFLEHTEFRFPTGIFDTLLWIGYFVILLSGFTGWVLLRTIPQPLRESDSSPSGKNRSGDCYPDQRSRFVDPRTAKVLIPQRVRTGLSFDSSTISVQQGPFPLLRKKGKTIPAKCSSRFLFTTQQLLKTRIQQCRR